jgi:hypothetical protein
MYIPDPAKSSTPHCDSRFSSRKALIQPPVLHVMCTTTGYTMPVSRTAASSNNTVTAAAAAAA